MCVREGPDHHRHLSRDKVEVLVCTFLLQDALSEVTKILPAAGIEAFC